MLPVHLLPFPRNVERIFLGATSEFCTWQSQEIKSFKKQLSFTD